MTQPNQTNVYLKRTGKDGGMIEHLQMNKKRIVDIGTAIEQSDGVNKEALDDIGIVKIESIVPRMTSNNTPSPYTATADSNTINAWKAFSTENNQWIPTTEDSQYLTIDFGTTRTINNIQMIIVGETDGLSIDVDGIIIYDKPSVLRGELNVMIPKQSASNLRFNFTPMDSTSGLSYIRVNLKTLDVDKETLVYCDGSDARQAVSVNYMDFVLAPLRSIVQVKYTNPPLTSDVDSGYLVVCSPIAQDGHPAYYAFNFASGSNWISVLNPVDMYATLSISLLVPQSIVAFEVAARDDTLNAGCRMFSLEGTNDMINYTTLLVVDTPVPQVKTVYKLSQASVVYQTYRLKLDRFQGASEIGLNAFNLQTNVLDLSNRRLTSVAPAVDEGDAVVLSQLNQYVKSNSAVFSGDVDMGDNRVTNMSDGTTTDDSVTLRQLTTPVNTLINYSAFSQSCQGILLFAGSYTASTAGFVKLPLDKETVNNLTNPNIPGYFQVTLGALQIIKAGTYIFNFNTYLSSTSDVGTTCFYTLRNAVSGAIFYTAPSMFVPPNTDRVLYKQCFEVTFANTGEVVELFAESNVKTGSNIIFHRLSIGVFLKALPVTSFVFNAAYAISNSYLSDSVAGVLFTLRPDISIALMTSDITISGAEISFNHQNNTLYTVQINALVAIPNSLSSITISPRLLNFLDNSLVFQFDNITLARNTALSKVPFAFRDTFMLSPQQNRLKLVLQVGHNVVFNNIKGVFLRSTL